MDKMVGRLPDTRPTGSFFGMTQPRLVVGWPLVVAALRGVGRLCVPGAPADELKGEGSVADRSWRHEYFSEY